MAKLQGCQMFGLSAGGIITTLMSTKANSGLFLPLWVGVSLLAVASSLIGGFLIEPERALHKAAAEEDFENIEESEGQIGEAKELDQKVLWNVIVGAFADNM